MHDECSLADRDVPALAPLPELIMDISDNDSNYDDNTVPISDDNSTVTFPSIRIIAPQERSGSSSEDEYLKVCTQYENSDTLWTPQQASSSSEESDTSDRSNGAMTPEQIALFEKGRKLFHSHGHGDPDFCKSVLGVDNGRVKDELQESYPVTKRTYKNWH